MPNLRPYKDGLPEKERFKLRREAWRSGMERPSKRWTEKHCAECRCWNKRDDPDNWCVHFKQSSPDVDAPNIDVFKPYFNPNIQPGGAWLETRRAERECMRLNGKEFRR